MSKHERPVSYQQTLGTKTERARQIPKDYDVSAFYDSGVTAENPTDRTKQNKSK
ncbi:hypothetical protein [Peribacillus sp. SCS-155]|uniref:hypothetical protein n=1 Tax=Peribacillus sedimenti TaxID=3115297 RepID=UPI0039065397